MRFIPRWALVLWPVLGGLSVALSMPVNGLGGDKPGLDSSRPGGSLPASQAGKVPAARGVLDINRASAEDFQKLPGIGPALAQRIVAYRRKHGPFRRVEDLMAIKGIGLKRWKAIRPYLRVGSDSVAKPK